MTRGKLKAWLWRVAGDAIAGVIERYANDRAFADDPAFVDGWSKRRLVVASLRYDRDPAAMGLLPDLMRQLARRKELYTFWQAHGASLYPNDYISPLPDLARLDPTTWPRAFDAPGLDYRFDHQIGLMDEVCRPYLQECHFPAAPTGDDAAFHRNPFFESVDAEVLYCLIRHRRPRRVIEVGSGYSTRLIAAACRRNAEELGWLARVTAIDPMPRATLAALGGAVEHDSRPVETLPRGYFDMLGAGDILFIDSSHVVRPGGDVVHLFLDVLPRLRPGVLVHVHDIFLPLDYPRDIVFDHHWFLTEQYLAHAFLLFNHAFQVEWASQAMARCREPLVRACFGAVGGSSLWLSRRDDPEPAGRGA